MYAVCDYCLEPIFDQPEFHGQCPLHSQCMDDLFQESESAGYPYSFDGDYEIGGEG